MGQFLDAAHSVLDEIGIPLDPETITTMALERGVLTTRGKTPSQTMKSKLATDILRKNDRSAFMRTGENMFALRAWRNDYTEYHAHRYQKALLDEEISVFPASILRDYVPHDGLTSAPIASQELLQSCFPLQRREAEERYDVVQLVSVFVIRHEGRYLTYKRSKRLPESRLHDAYSLHFGGHLNPEDTEPLLDIFRPDLGLPLLQRELKEELSRIDRPDFSYKGLLYDSSRDISSQHLGIVYEVQVEESDFEIGERGFLIDAKFESEAEISARLTDFENWSVLLLKECRDTRDRVEGPDRTTDA